MPVDSLTPFLAKGQQYFERIRKAEKHGSSEIQIMFEGSVVFITGGSGFLGKQLVEKLLRSCPGIQKIYLLLRERKGMTVTERLEKQWKDPVYDELRKIEPEFRRRVFPIRGEVAELRLGIKDEDWNRIKHEINFVFHTAATVRFDEPLLNAVLVNVRGTREMLSLANDLPNLKALVHVSSAYANCNHSEVHEVFYDTPINPETMLQLTETLDEPRLNAICAGLIEGWPNTYTFSKALAENLIRRTAQYLPVCVVRPCIITPTFQEPAGGWLDIRNVFGPSGTVMGVGLGFIHTMWARTSVTLDLVPLDYVNNLTVASAWDTVRRHERNQKDVKIYTCSRNRNRVPWGAIDLFLNTKARWMVTPRAIWYCYAYNTQYYYLFLIYSIFLHFIPGLILDGLLMSTGNKPRVTQAYCTAFKLNKLLSHFVQNDWVFHDDSVKELRSKMSEKDRQIYQFDVADIDNDEVLTAWCIGLRKYIVKDGLKGTDRAIKMQRWLRLAHYVITVLYAALLWYVFRGLYDVVKLFMFILITS